VPQSIVEYRPEAQLRAFVRDPRSFRYTQMPANPQLSEADLDALLAYFRHMSAYKLDPLEVR
jgi:cytochrome c1